MSTLTESTNFFRTQPRRIDLAQRAITIDAVIEDVEHEGAKGEVVLGLRVSHNKERRCFIASVTRGIRHNAGTHTVTTTSRTFGRDGQLNYVSLFQQPVARYSAKALEAALEDALRQLDQMLGCEDFQPILRPYNHAIEGGLR